MTFDEWFGSFDGEGMLPMAVIRMAFEAGKQSEREVCADMRDEAIFTDYWTAIRERVEKK